MVKVVVCALLASVVMCKGSEYEGFASALQSNSATVLKAWPKGEEHVVTVGIKYGMPQTYQGVTLIVNDSARGVVVIWSHDGKLDEIPAGNYTGIIKDFLWTGVE